MFLQAVEACTPADSCISKVNQEHRVEALSTSFSCQAVPGLLLDGSVSIAYVNSGETCMNVQAAASKGSCSSLNHCLLRPVLPWIAYFAHALRGFALAATSKMGMHVRRVLGRECLHTLCCLGWTGM